MMVHMNQIQNMSLLIFQFNMQTFDINTRSLEVRQLLFQHIVHYTDNLISLTILCLYARKRNRNTKYELTQAKYISIGTDIL